MFVSEVLWMEVPTDECYELSPQNLNDTLLPTYVESKKNKDLSSRIILPLTPSFPTIELKKQNLETWFPSVCIWITTLRVFSNSEYETGLLLRNLTEEYLYPPLNNTKHVPVFYNL